MALRWGLPMSLARAGSREHTMSETVHSALDIAAAVKSGTLTAVAAAEAALARIAARDGEINAFTEITRERALR